MVGTPPLECSPLHLSHSAQTIPNLAFWNRVATCHLKISDYLVHCHFEVVPHQRVLNSSISMNSTGAQGFERNAFPSFSNLSSIDPKFLQHLHKSSEWDYFFPYMIFVVNAADNVCRAKKLPWSNTAPHDKQFGTIFEIWSNLSLPHMTSLSAHNKFTMYSVLSWFTLFCGNIHFVAVHALSFLYTVCIKCIFSANKMDIQCPFTANSISSIHAWYIQCKHSVYSVQIHCILSAKAIYIQR